MLKNRIYKQIELIDQSLLWLKQNKPDDFKSRLFSLADIRRKLRILYDAELDNPAIAAYGESQKGKSYLITNLLKKKEKPFEIVSGEERYDFIDRINPRSNNTEATSVVTRFTAFRNYPERYVPDFPVMLRMLSVTDIVCILTDSYRNDVHDSIIPEKTAFENHLAPFLEKYAEKPDQENAVITEDDILNLGEHIHTQIDPNLYAPASTFLEELLFIIRKVDPSDWAPLFGILWNNEPAITALFERLTGVLAQMEFTPEAYVPISAVLNDENTGTILSVDCLKRLYDENALTTIVMYRNRNGEKRQIGPLSRPEICAVCKEVVFKIEDEYLTEELRYSPEGIEDPRYRNKGAVKRDILNTNDLLDFPGARARSEVSSDAIQKNLVFILLRGKVAYLFARYSATQKLNVLMFCHDHIQSGQSLMPITLESWIKNIGSTPEERKAYISKIGMSPLFIINTKFNCNVEVEPTESKNLKENLGDRWNERFEKVLYNECLQGKSKAWVDNWTAEGVPFQNCYLLRDFKYSDGKTYSGYRDHRRETSCLIEDVEIAGVRVNFYRNLRQSFCENRHVRRFFRNPALSWDVANSMNNDGSVYIIENLAVAAANLHEARTGDFSRRLGELSMNVYRLMKEYHHTDDLEDILKARLMNARRIRRNLDFAFGKDNYYFGHLINSLQVLEQGVSKRLHSMLEDPGIIGKGNTSDEYEMFRESCRLDQCRTVEEMKERFMEYYGFFDEEEMNGFLRQKGMDPALLFRLETTSNSISAVIARGLLEDWKKQVKSSVTLTGLTADGAFDTVDMTNLLDNLVACADEVGLEDKIRFRIEQSVDTSRVASMREQEDLLSDVIASEINNFVNDFGIHFRDGDYLQRVRTISDQKRLGIFEHLGEDRKSSYDEEELTALFNSLADSSGSSNGALIPSLTHHFYEWECCMMASFIGNVSVGEYDLRANEELKILLDQIKEP